MEVGCSAGAGTVDYNHQGRYAEGFIASIAFAAGFEVFFPRAGAEESDLSVHRPSHNKFGTPQGSRGVFFQVKSWSVGGLGSDGSFHYPLKVSTHNRLTLNHQSPHYLALCLVPAESGEYVVADHDELMCRRAAYWFSLRGAPPAEGVDRDSTRTVLVPARNLLTPATLSALVEGDESRAVLQ